MLRSLLTSLLRQPRLVIAIGVLFLIALVWFGGPLLGLESFEARGQVVIGIVLLIIVVYLLDYYLAQQRAAQLEASLHQQAQEQFASARPDRQEELEAVRKQFENGVAALKESKLGGGLKGKAALYALPWYMFIGPPASGKSTALRHSGLQFPYLGGSGQGLQGVGGTRNCDWWFTNEAVLLDTAGRYVTHEEDQEEWLGFLDLLKRYRKGKPINGVLAAISIADLFQASEEELESHAKRVRNRIDELIKRLGIVFPVYLIFTKCDLIQGFVEFFEDLNKAERDRIWGCTFPKSAASSDPPHVRFGSEFDELAAALHARRLTRLASTRGPHKVSIYGFPLQLASGRDKLARFVEILFQPNLYQENPLFRGFYLTSGTQEGTPIDRILGAVSRASGLSDVVVASFGAAEPKSYFLKDLFTQVIFPDRGLSGPSSTIHRQRGYFRVGVFVLSTLVVIASVVGLATSFLGNKRLLTGALSAALTVPQPSLIDDLHLEKNLDFLARLGGRFDELRSYEVEGVPIRLWGLYRGDRLFELVRDLYATHFQRILLDPTKRDMEDSLAQLVSDAAETSRDQGSDFYYSLLKAYIMLGEPSHLNSPYLERWLWNIWKERMRSYYGTRPVPDWVMESMNHQMTLYSYYLAKDVENSLVLNRRLVQEVQRNLRRVPTVERIYGLSRREAEDKAKPFSVDVALRGSYQGSLTSDYSIPGVFTYEGWKGAFQNGLAQVLEDFGQEGWVIGEPETKRADLEQTVKKLYFEDYVEQWRAFVKSLRVRPVVTPANAEETLAILSQTDSPLIQVLQAIERNTIPELEGMGKLQGTATGLLEKVKKQLGLASVGKEQVEALRRLGATGDFSSSVSPKFKVIHQLISVPKDSKEEAPLALYLAELRKVHQALRPILRSESAGADTKAIARSIVSGEPSDLTQAIKSTDFLLQKLDPDSRELILPLLGEPWIIAMRGVMDRAKADASRRWEAEVYQACQRNIEGRYPFRAVGQDAALTDLMEFFHPQNGMLWKFYQAELRPFVEESPERWEPKTWHGAGMSLSDEFLSNLQHAKFLSESLFPKGATDVEATYELYPHPPQGIAGRSVTEVRLEVGGQPPLRYRMEPQEWYEMKWPGTSAALGTVLQVQVGNAWVTKVYKDAWGFFKLLDAGRVIPGNSDTQFRVQWDLTTPDSRTVQVQYDLRARSYKNPFRPGFFAEFRCMSRL